MHSMSDRMRQARATARLSQTQLAAQVGVQRSAVAQWERHGCSTAPSTDNLVRVAVATGACVEWLATGRGPAYPHAGEFDVAAMPHDFAQSEAESRLLILYRQMTSKRRELALDILEVMRR